MCALKNSEGNTPPLLDAMQDVEEFFTGGKEGQLYKFLLNVVEKPLIESILARTRGNQVKAAHILGINRNTLHSKIQKLNINVDNFRNG